MADIAYICGTKTDFWTLEEVRKLLPLLIRISQRREKAIQKAMNDQRFYMKSGAPQSQITICDDLVGKEMAKWGKMVYKLGGKVYRDGWVGFDFGAGVYLWHLGEKDINWYMGFHDDPVIQRRPLTPVGLLK